jgi:hypothetical protein
MQRMFYNPGENPFPSGKLTVENTRVPIKGQYGITCLLKLLRRLAYLDHEDETAHTLYKNIKFVLDNFDRIKEKDYSKFEELLSEGNKLCEKFKINFKEKALLNKSFQLSYAHFKKTNQHIDIDSYFENLDLYVKCNLLYTVIVDDFLMPYMNIRNSNWNPSRENAFEELAEALKIDGPHLFIGKFGRPFYPQGSQEQYKELSTAMRHIFIFDRNKYAASDLAPHWIMIDQVSIIKNRQMVYYRDPTDMSDPSYPERVYIMSYQAFANRLTDRLGNPYSTLLHDKDDAFGLACEDFRKHYLQHGDVDANTDVIFYPPVTGVIPRK